MPIRAIVVDRDGVLTYFDAPAAAARFATLLPISLPEIVRRWERWGAQVGCPATAAEERQFLAGFWDEIADEFALRDPQRRDLHVTDYTHFMHAFPDARPALVAARERGLAIGVLSNFALATLETSLAAVGLLDLVDAACAATVIGKTKPQPEAYWAVADLLGVTPGECLLFDDEVECVEGGRATGMVAYLVDRRRRQHALEEFVVRDLSALPSILAQ